MQIQINKEFRDYRDKVYFGLSMRQFIFLFLAVGVAIVSYILPVSYTHLGNCLYNSSYKAFASFTPITSDISL